MIPNQAVVSLGLVKDDQTCAVVISHDCDIVEDDLKTEPFVEVIIGNFLLKQEPNLTHAKSPNRLHLRISAEQETYFVELQATRKTLVPKTSLSPFHPDPKFSLDSKNREILQNWLAARYRRAVFPDALNQHLGPLRETLQNLGKRWPEAIIGFYIEYDPEGEISDPDEPYEVGIVVVFDHTVRDAAQVADEAVQKISERLRQKFKSDNGWRYVELRSCSSRSAADFSLYEAMTMKPYRLDYISLKTSGSTGLAPKTRD